MVEAAVIRVLDREYREVVEVYDGVKEELSLVSFKTFIVKEWLSIKSRDFIV